VCKDEDKRGDATSHFSVCGGVGSVRKQFRCPDFLSVSCRADSEWLPENTGDLTKKESRNRFSITANQRQ